MHISKLGGLFENNITTLTHRKIELHRFQTVQRPARTDLMGAVGGLAMH